MGAGEVLSLILQGLQLMRMGSANMYCIIAGLRGARMVSLFRPQPTGHVGWVFVFVVAIVVGAA